jgi:hypothetical protein
MPTLQAIEAKTRITALLARIKACKASAGAQPDVLCHTMATTIRYQRMAQQAHRA